MSTIVPDLASTDLRRKNPQEKLIALNLPVGMRFLIALLAGVSAGAATLGQQTITLAAAPAPLLCSGQRYVNSLTIRVLPGFEGKVFIGTSTMNPNIYANTLAILFPNLGAHSEEYVVTDPSGDDGIDLCSIYVAGEIPGESAIAEYISNNGGTLPPAYLLVPTFVQAQPGGVTQSFSNDTIIRAQVIPGYPDPFFLGADWTGEIALDPNVGDITQHNAWSEKWERSDPLGANGLTASIFVGPYANFGDALLLSAWQKQTAAGVLAVAAMPWQVVTSYAAIGNLPAVFPTGPLFGLHVKRVPFTLYDGKDELDDSQGNPLAVLFPNSIGIGWSEEIDFGAGNIGNGPTALSDSGNWDSVAYDYLAPQADTTAMPSAMGTAAVQTGGLVGGVGNVAIGRGYVKRLRVQVVPGGVGKIYIGSASMDTSAFTGVYAILYPNAVGRFSETLEIEDPEGDGISTDDLCIQTEVLGEQAIVSTTATGVVPPDGVLTVKASGPLAGSYGSYAVPFVTTSTPAAILRAQAIPGGDGKLWIGTGGMTAAQPDPSFASVLKVLWPSQGNYDVGEGFSERFVEACHAGPASAPNCLDLANYTFWPYIPSEELLVFALGR
jgi:hypothetical protein